MNSDASDCLPRDYRIHIVNIHVLAITHNKGFPVFLSDKNARPATWNLTISALPLETAFYRDFSDLHSV